MLNNSTSKRNIGGVDQSHYARFLIGLKILNESTMCIQDFSQTNYVGSAILSSKIQNSSKNIV